ncbi:Jun protein [Fasciola hepatica]|uniref:Jun protein n=1 Tax=Fasciola hepatica TaxID=6192 RepID=A0A4E0QZR5_FASHE|nr:Jun protein [Fasciola hepatica]
MPENRCELVFVQSGELPSTKPLRVITQYSSVDDINMQSPGRPTTLGVCVAAAHNNKDGKEGTVVSRISGMEENSQSWSAKMVDNGDFEKLLGQLGSNGSTPVTPTSFLNPRNITEDQEIFAE